MSFNNRTSTWLTLTLGILASSASYSQNCTSADQREPVEQMDCFCNPIGKSLVQKKLDTIGSYVKPFKLETPSKCSSAALYVFGFSQDPKIDEKVSAQMKVLGYADEDVQWIVDRAKVKLKIAKTIPKKSILDALSFTVGQYKVGSKIKNSTVDLSSLSDSEQWEVYTFPSDAKFGSFTYYFKKLDQVSALVNKYPAEKISKCSAVTTDLDLIGQCLDSSTVETKISACTSMKLLEGDTLRCLSAKADVSQIEACRSLYLTSADAIECLNKNAQPEIIQACGRLLMLGKDTLSCISSGASVTLIDLCRSLRLTEPDTQACIYSKASAEKIRDCVDAGLLGADLYKCLIR
jgi:hypothetical protein